MTQILIRIITGLLGAFAFGVVFNVKGVRLIFSSLGGLLAISLYELLVYLNINVAVSCFLVSSTVTLYAEFLARVLKTPITTFIMTALIPLVPGAALYYTMSNGLAKNTELFKEYGFSALAIAVSLAIGIIFITTIFQLITMINDLILHKKS